MDQDGPALKTKATGQASSSAPNGRNRPRSLASSRARSERPAKKAGGSGKRGKPAASRFKRESLARRRDRLAEILQQLHRAYPAAECALDHASPLQLLVATILSAQCTDERVNMVTPALFEQFPDAAALAASAPEDLERAIHSTGFYRNKAKNIRACCEAILRDHEGQVPETMEDLVRLAGVGRKTANVVRGACFGLPAITVDTHCGRLSRRLGLTSHTDPDKVEEDLQKLMPPEEWWFFSSAIIWHGRRICHARKPECCACVLSDLCPSSTCPPTAPTP